MNNEDLKPCPFCGGEAHTFGHTKSWGVLCTKCYVSTLRYETKAAAMAVWNRHNYPEKQNSLKELMDFVEFCQKASTGCIVYINNRARDIIAKSKGKRVCVKQNAETLDTKSVASNQLNAKLTYADIERMVKPLKWEQLTDPDDPTICAGVSVGKLDFLMREMIFEGSGGEKSVWAKINTSGGEGGSEIHALSRKDCKAWVQEWFVNLVAAALGVERSGE